MARYIGLAVIGVALGIAAAAAAWDSGVEAIYSAAAVTAPTTARVIRVDTTHPPVVLHTLSVRGHGGMARVEWVDSEWVPTLPHTGSYVSIYIDGVRRASTLLGGLVGSTDARPGQLIWFGRLTRATHEIQVRVTRADGGFEIPGNTHSGSSVDGLYVTEYVP